MPDEIKVDAAKFDRILGRMLDAKPLSKAEISERIRKTREAAKAHREKSPKAKAKYSKKLGQ
jgi:hypothetical protein